MSIAEAPSLPSKLLPLPDMSRSCLPEQVELFSKIEEVKDETDHQGDRSDSPAPLFAGNRPRSRRGHQIPLPLREIMDRRIERRRSGCLLIFHSGGKSFKASQGGLPNRFYAIWKRACGNIGLPNLRPYDLRRSAVRNLIHAGVPEITAMKISGHGSRETFRRYAIEDPSELAAAFEKLGAYVTPRMRSQSRSQNRAVRFVNRRRKTGTTRAARVK